MKRMEFITLEVQQIIVELKIPQAFEHPEALKEELAHLLKTSDSILLSNIITKDQIE